MWTWSWHYQVVGNIHHGGRKWHVSMVKLWCKLNVKWRELKLCLGRGISEEIEFIFSASNLPTVVLNKYLTIYSNQFCEVLQQIGNSDPTHLSAFVLQQTPVLTPTFCSVDWLRDTLTKLLLKSHGNIFCYFLSEQIYISGGRFSTSSSKSAKFSTFELKRKIQCSSIFIIF